MIYGLQDYMVFTALMDSLEQAFLARQDSFAPRLAGWGERFFVHLEQHHSEWTLEMVSVYATAQQILQHYVQQQCGGGLSHMICRRPEGFVEAVLMQLGKPQSSLN